MMPMKKKLLWGIFVVIVFGSIFLMMRNRTTVALPQNGTTVVVFGDSLVEGIGAESGGDFPSQLERLIGASVINAGIAGDTTTEALMRFDSDVIAHDPKVVIILLGGNDALQNVSPDTTFANIETMIARSRAYGAGVILIGVRGGLHNTEYKKRFKSLSRTYETAYIQDAHKGIFRDKDLMADAIHPNTAGYEIIATRIVPVLQEMLN